MKKTTSKEWQLVCDLHRVLKKVHNQNQKNFIKGLYNNLDEYTPFLEEQTEEQLEYLKTLHEIYIK